MHVLVETNWVVGCAAPAHHQDPAARALLDRAGAGEVKLYLPAVCLNEARRAIQKFQPRHEANAIRSFLAWSKGTGQLSGDDDRTIRRALDMFEAKVKADLKTLDARLTALRSRAGVEVFALDETMLERAIDLSGGELDFLQPFDQAILAAVVVRAERLRGAGAGDVVFCEADADLQPWDKRGDARPPLKRLYDAARIWVHGDFDLNALSRSADW
jgi:predicted nucleic acid-binding protein